LDATRLYGVPGNRDLEPSGKFLLLYVGNEITGIIRALSFTHRRLTTYVCTCLRKTENQNHVLLYNIVKFGMELVETFLKSYFALSGGAVFARKSKRICKNVLRLRFTPLRTKSFNYFME